MTEQHPITPPPELVREWNEAAIGTHFPPYGYSEYIAAQAARWGADQELEGCCEWLRGKDILEPAIEALRAVRRPQPPSLKEQALDALNLMLMFVPPGDQREQGEAIRRALEQLDD